MKKKSKLRKSLVRKIEKNEKLAAFLKKIQKHIVDVCLIVPYTKKFNLINALSLYRLSRQVNVNNKTTTELTLPQLKHPLKIRRGTSDINVFKQIFFLKEYDISELDKINPKIIIDCGSNTGFSTIYFKNRYPDAKIISIEPEESNFELLKKNIENYSDIATLQTAIWSENANLKIINPENRGWGFRVVKTEANDKNSFKATSIASLMNSYHLNNVDILKIDIEGAEKEIFEKNFENWLPKTAAIIIELHERYAPGCTETVLGVMKKYHFSKTFSGENYVFINNNHRN